MLRLSWYMLDDFDVYDYKMMSDFGEIELEWRNKVFEKDIDEENWLCEELRERGYVYSRSDIRDVLV